jgi:hypothetical protein
MKPIISPLKFGDTGAGVENLQDALLLLIDGGIVQLSADEVQFVKNLLSQEQQERTYKDGTSKVVTLFQQHHHLQSTGEVDAPTAGALNKVLKDLGALDTTGEGQKRMAAGQVVQDDNAPFRGTVILFGESDQGSIQLGEDATDPEGRYTIVYDPALGLDGAKLRVAAFDPDGKLRADATIEAAKPVEIVNLTVPREAPSYRVEGKVASASRAGVGGLRVRIVDRNVGTDIQLFEVVTDGDGSYSATFPYAGPKQKLDLQARVFAVAGEPFLGASDVHYNASQHETLDVLLDNVADSALPSEHEALTGVLASQFTGRLADLKETDEQQDITYLANKTGNDARLVALLALADQFSERTIDATGAPTIPQEFFYALFRAGLPANDDALYQTDAGTVEAAWQRAAEQGLIPQTSATQIPNIIERFQALSAQKLLTSPALVGPSSLQDMLGVSGLEDAQQQATFAQLYAANRTDLPAFWQAVGDTFGQDTANRLQADGKLARLTVNNGPLMQKIQTTAGQNGLSGTLQLAQTGYHRPEAWNQLLTAGVPVPEEIPGDTPETRRANYADYLAAQVRLSYPTAAVAQMVESGELLLTGAANGVSEQVHAFLTEHQGRFEIGVQPVERYVAQNDLQVPNETIRQVKRLQRVYQITPSDQALTGLMKRGVDSAYKVVSYDRETFVQSFAADLGGVERAALTYDKSVQVHNAVLNIALSYMNARTAPAIGVHSPPSVLDPAPADTGDVIAFATLESLFGSMDFCACEHCRSILSPAAYLVDLLMFLDQADPPPGTENPQTVLLERRPDIQHLPLTCENTNTALPYIDVVNETLEYYVANDVQRLSLNGYVGHDTDGFASEDLLASPQFVMDSAYMTLRDESFPAPLPFHQPLESLRRYFEKFEVALPLAMERLRNNDHLERGANPYGWRDILMEEIRLSRDEYEILTDSDAVPLWRMYGLPGGTTDADAVAGLSNAKQFTRRVDITYEDLVSVLKTRFINPNGGLIPKVERLGVDFAVLAELKTKNDAPTDAKFDALLAALAVPPDPAAYGGDIKAWVKNDDNYTRIMGLVTLAVPAGTWIDSKAYALGDCVRPTAAHPDSALYYECTTPGTSAASEPEWPTSPGDTRSDGTVVWTCRDASSCLSFDNLAFRYADPAKATQDISSVEFVRMLRFVRLCKRLGWTIEQIDAAIGALYRADTEPLGAEDVDTVAKLDAGFLTLLPRLGAIVRVMNALNLTPERDLLPLLACWSELGTYGDTALYRRMFLNPARVKQDAVFADNGHGEFLTDTTEKLADHAETLRSAFNLSGGEYYQIVAALGYDANTPLTMPNVSEIFRRGWLARKLGLSVHELLLLIRLTGLEPFAMSDPTDPAILRLIHLVQALRNRSLKPSAALYLIWNQDLSGKSEPGAARIAAFARTLRVGLAAVEAEFAVADDPDGATTQAQLAKVYGADAATFFSGLLNDTLVVEVEFSDPDGTLAADAVRQAIEAAAGKRDSGAPKIAYDDFRTRLSYSGVLSDATQEAIKSAAGAGAAAFKDAVDNLYGQNQGVVDPFFTRYPELQAAYHDYVSDTTLSAAEKRNNLLKALLPELVQRRKRQQTLRTVSATANSDPAFVQALLDPPAASFPLHAAGRADQPALNDFLALETRGLSVQFFASDTATGTIISSPSIPHVAANLDYAPLVDGVGNPLPAHPTPSAAISGIWSGYLEAPESGFFKLRIVADAGATVRLRLDGKQVTLTQNATTQNATVWSNASPIALQAGMLCAIDLTVEQVRDAVRVQWEWEPKGQGRAVIPARYLYPAMPFESFKQAYDRFLKVASLAKGLSLTANEMAHFATDADHLIAGDGWLNALPVSGDSPHPDKLLEPFEALLDFARIKAEVSPSDESLLAILEDPTAATQGTDSLLFATTRWGQSSLDDMLVRFGDNIAGLGHFNLFRRVYDAFALVRKMGISARALIQATTNDPSGDTVRDLRSALRARYAAPDWRDVTRPINDEMRGLQRDALVAYILHRMRSNPESAHIDTSDKLFEYFLMDVQMDPCMQTSRIRHALSSVQLFAERCLMNLEPRVSSAAINAKQWEWMKRYRVWEANRKVYLFPENWLEPELRDDKSPFFKGIESELLQSDITEDSATTAVLNYLAKLEEVAKLEPCGMYYVEPTDEQGEVIHLVARTAGAHRKYYYRRYEFGFWTPWEHIKLDIEDNPVLPVVWKDRLLLFWLRILQQGPRTAQKPFSKGGSFASLDTANVNTDTPQVTIQAVLCWSEYYNGEWQSAKTSDVNLPTTIYSSSLDDFDRKTIRLGVAVEGDALRVYIRDTPLRTLIAGVDDIRWPGSFLFYNTHSLPIRGDAGVVAVPSAFAPERRRDLAGDPRDFALKYSDVTGADFTREILTTQIPFGVIDPRHQLRDAWDVPVFFTDSRHVFLVTSEEQPIWVGGYGGYGIFVDPGVLQEAQIPPLVVPTAPPPKPKFWGDGGPIVADGGVVDPASMRRFITEDAYIRRGLGTTLNVRYGDRQIGPSGAISDGAEE